MCRAVPDHILLGTSDLDRGIAFVNASVITSKPASRDRFKTGQRLQD